MTDEIAMADAQPFPEASPPVGADYHLVFALVRTLGTEMSNVEQELDSLLATARMWTPEWVTLSALLSRIDVKKHLVDSPTHRRYKTHMDVGDDLRFRSDRPDALLMLAIREVADSRRAWRTEHAGQPSGGPAEHWRGFAARLRSLMTPEEVTTLRDVYGSRAFIISATSSLDTRRSAMANKIALTTGSLPDHCTSLANDLISRDAGLEYPDQQDPAQVTLHPSVAPEPPYQSKKGYQVNMENTYEMADVFVAPSDWERTQRTLERFVELIFSHPYHTPTLDELGMYMAYGAAMSSASLSRRVGAAIFSPDGAILAIGTNEVPRYGGGLYRAEEKPDHRDFQRGIDSSDVAKREFLVDILARLRHSGWLSDDVITGDNPAEWADLALTNSLIRSARMFDVIEYSRALHAEMAALSDAARHGISVKGATMFVTTFSCHNCAREIVGAGIERVVYIEAYPKSRVARLYEDTIGLVERHEEVGRRVRFEPFVGIGPRRFVDLFSAVARRQSDLAGSEAKDRFSGQIVSWNLSSAAIREAISPRDPSFQLAQEVGINTAERSVSAHARRLAEDYIVQFNEEAGNGSDR